MKRRRTSKTGTEPTALTLQAEACLELAAAEDGQPRRPTFTIDAYNGGAMRIGGFFRPVVVDLSGLRASQRVPILLDHDPSQIVGQSSEVTIGRKTVRLAGAVTGDAEVVGDPAQKVVAHAKNGFRWAASVGIGIDRLESVPEGATVKVNGSEWAGPLWVVRAGRLGEVSLVAVGADETAAARIAAALSKETVMSFEEWLKAKGFDHETLTDTQRQTLQAAWQAEQAAKDEDDDTDDEAETTVQASGASDTAPDTEEPEPAAIEKRRAELAAEERRVAAIRKLCGTQHAEIAAKAIEEGWSTDRCELEILRAERPKAPAVHVSAGGAVTPQVLEAACLLAGRMDGVEQHCEAPALEAASRRFRGGIGLQELLLEAAWANGYTGRSFRDHQRILQFAFGQHLQAGFSTIDIGGILSNVANKFLLAGFFAVERTWRNICAVRNVSDFKKVTSYRLVGAEQYEEVKPGGELKQGTLGEQVYQNQADTHGLLLSIDRRDIINDDLGAITTVPRKLGRGSGLKINDVFWKTFLASSNFFKAANNNYLEGADTALGINALTAAEVLFNEQTDPDGNPLGILPAILLVPTALSATATTLYKSQEIRETTANTRYPIGNPHVGKFRPEVSRYLSNSKYPGHSAKAWYVLADPNDLPVIEVALLNGQESPTIETSEANFNVLGIQMRGYHDFGVSLQEPRGGVRVKGEV